MLAHSSLSSKPAAACSSSRARGTYVPLPIVSLAHPRDIQSTRASKVCCRAAAAATHLALHIGADTTIQMPFTAGQAQTLDAALAKLLQTFSDKQAAARPRRWDMMEVRFSGAEAGEGMEVLEVFCNPNAHATAFDAKLLITIKAMGGLKVVCEGRLSSIKADLDAFLHSLNE